MKKPQKEQFNTRLSGDLKRAMRIMSAVMDTSTEELTEVLLAASLGSRDPKIRAKQELVAKKAEEMSLSFNETDLQPGSLLAA